MDLGHRDGRLEQDAAIESSPCGVWPLDAVGDDDVGVELRVAGTGVPVVEGGGDDTAGVELGDPVMATSSERGVLLDKVDDVVDCFMMCGNDLLLHTDVRGHPQRRN
ncbi:hypothetical protein GCM10029976_038660 [Kribbella albertanoniae]